MDFQIIHLAAVRLGEIHSRIQYGSDCIVHFGCLFLCRINAPVIRYIDINSHGCGHHPDRCLLNALKRTDRGFNLSHLILRDCRIQITFIAVAENR